MTRSRRILTGAFALALAAMLLPAVASAQAATAPKDPTVRPPLPDAPMCSLDCDYCKRAIKRMLKDPDARPMLGERGEARHLRSKPGEARHHRDKMKKRGNHHERRSREMRGHVKRDKRKWRAEKRHHERAERTYKKKARRRNPNAAPRWMSQYRASPRHEARRRARRAMEMAERLNLSEEQRERMREIREERRLEAIDLKAELEKQEIELRRLMRETGTTDAALRKQIEEMAKHRAELEFLKLKARRDAREILTDEQREKIIEKEKKKEKKKRRR